MAAELGFETEDSDYTTYGEISENKRPVRGFESTAGMAAFPLFFIYFGLSSILFVYDLAYKTVTGKFFVYKRNSNKRKNPPRCIVSSLSYHLLLRSGEKIITLIQTKKSESGYFCRSPYKTCFCLHTQS